MHRFFCTVFCQFSFCFTLLLAHSAQEPEWGGAYATFSGPGSIRGNPAGLGLQEQVSFAFHGKFILGLPELPFTAVALLVPMQGFVAGMALSHAGGQWFRETSACLSAGRRIGKHWFWGGGIGLQTGFHPQWNPFLQQILWRTGGMFLHGKRWRSGITLYGTIPPSKERARGIRPDLGFRAGLSYRTEEFLLMGECILERLHALAWMAGISCVPFPSFFVCCSVGTGTVRQSAGLGFQQSHWLAGLFVKRSQFPECIPEIYIEYTFRSK